jgi:hypothetical protein
VIDGGGFIEPPRSVVLGKRKKRRAVTGADNVVYQSFAEWCFIFDLIGGIGIFLPPLS